MGLDWRSIGYLWYLSQLEGITPADVDVVGEDPAKCICPFQLHQNTPWMLGWWVENWRDYLSGKYLL